MFLHESGTDPHDSVSVHESSLIIHCYEPVSVTVKGKTNVSVFAYDLLLEIFRMCRTAVQVNVVPIRLTPGADHICSEPRKDCRSNCRSSSVSSVENYLHAIESVVYRRYEEIYIIPFSVLFELAPADIRANRELLSFSGKDHFLYLVLEFVCKLVALRIEDLESVIFD